MLSTLSEARESTLRNISGSCPNTAEFLALLNDATRSLLRRGDWPGTIVPIQICVYSGCIVFPRYAGFIRAINVCKSRVPIRNHWWDFLLPGPDALSCWHQWCGASCRTVGQDRSPVFQDVMGEGRFIRAYCRYNADIGKTLTIFGTDNNGQTLVHKNADGSIAEGKVLTFGTPFASTDTYVRHIDRVLKDETEGPIDVYAYDAANDVLEDVAHYEPSETNPSYARYQLDLPRCGNDCGTLKSVVALVKLQFVPAKVDTDLVLIENLDALKLMMQSLKEREARNLELAKEFEADAIRELNLDLWNRDQENQIPVSMGETNGMTFSQQCF